MTSLDRFLRSLENVDTVVAEGEVLHWDGLLAHARCPSLAVGHLVQILVNGGYKLAEVVGFNDRTAQLMPLEDMSGLAPGARVRTLGRELTAKVGPDLLGRVLNGLGEPIDDRGPLLAEGEYPLQAQAPPAMRRKRITEPLGLGIRAIDGVLTIGKGQRVGIFAGSGVGKSTVLGMIARNTAADINVIALVGERGREVLEFIEASLGEEGRARSVVVVATSNDYALQRVKAPMVAMAIAEYFRDQGKDVLFMMDSLTRLAMAQRDIGQARGEPPATKGYPPSVFTLLPQFLERAGTSDKGTITGLITVLVEGDEMNEPIADTARGILDGHIVLSRKMAHRNHYPAIDIMQSVSRVMPEITSADHRHSAGKLREALATYSENEDLINIGAYKPGSNAQIDLSIKKRDAIVGFLRQGVHEQATFSESLARLLAMFPPAEWADRPPRPVDG
ncbi:MAG: FliI/YscN family ATPase [Armatimonadetes bacterium]|nr:FliI/YscN family ATPase [Armatimonadota bacterium]